VLTYSDEIMKNLITINFLPSDDDSISQLLLGMLNDGLQNASSVSWLLRLFESSKNPTSLALKVLDAIETQVVKNGRYSEDSGAFLLFLAEKEQSAVVHERIISLVATLSKQSNFTFNWSLAKVVVFLTEKNLCTSEASKLSHDKLHKFAEKHFYGRYYDDHT
jgi:hypothetical protein